jgi:HlyD family secretion protein
MTTRTRIALAIAVLGAAAGGLWFYQRAEAGEAPAYRFGTVERADLAATVSATGTLGAVTTVQVGTQVSGQISAILVDFNDRVRKGQLLARIDPVLHQQAVAEAEAALDRAQAQLTLATEEYERNRQLFAQQIVTAAEFGVVESDHAVARSSLRSAQINLDRARQNLSYTAIHAPIDGVIVSRDVDVGQTVAASLSAPQLFLIAQDLTEMQILAAVDESDIGRIAVGQPVRFTVTAYPDASFDGAVQQVRLKSAVTDNVVNYTVVVRVPNPDGKLLPGMTATVRFVTRSAEDVLTVPNAALRFTPPGQAAPTRGPALWTEDAGGRLVPVRVTTGLTDGQRTQVEGPTVTEGMRVILGTAASGAAPTGGAATSNPFQPQRQGGPPRPPGTF